MHSSQQFDYLIFIGRFEPFHQGHHYVITQALAHARQVIVLMGSANSPRTIKNPFHPDERQAMILNSFDKKIVNAFTVLVSMTPLIMIINGSLKFKMPLSASQPIHPMNTLVLLGMTRMKVRIIWHFFLNIRHLWSKILNTYQQHQSEKHILVMIVPKTGKL